MGHRTYRFTLFAVLAALSVGLMPAAQSQPLLRGKPAKVGRVTMVASGQHSLKFRWPAVPGADRYVIEQGSSLTMSGRETVEKTDRHKITIKNLQPGGLYCFQVRAVRNSVLGDRSKKACQYTIARRSVAAGVDYRVVTYNTCAVACSGWKRRRPAAANLVARQDPAVVMLQETPEDSGMAERIGGMREIVAHSGKVLLMRSSRFDVASAGGRARKGVIDLGLDPRARKHRYAVWAELIDRRHQDKRVIFVSVHLSPGRDTERADEMRRRNTAALVSGLRRINPAGRPLVIGGDFNSNQGRTYDSPGRLMKQAGFANAFFSAGRWTRPNYNSATQDRLRPTLGTPWGYHVDQVWSIPGRSRVHRWRNANRIVNGSYPAPQISNHSPVMVEVAVS